MTSILYVKIPSDISRALETLVLDLSADGSGLVEDTAGDQLPSHLKKDVDEEIFTIETAPLKRMINGAQEDAEDNAGVYAYYYSSTTGSELGRLDANVRATCLAMACGLHSQRFYGDVFISRLGYYSTGVQDGVKLTNASFTAKEVEFACQTPDLRLDIIETITGISKNDISLPRWITEAARNNYEDSAALSVLASVMKTDKEIPSQHESMLGGESGYESDLGSSSDSDDEMADNSKQSSREFVTKVPLCLHCRRPSSNICPICKGAYFCASPSSCKDLGWSHKAICCTWAIYTSHRDELSTFPFAGWQAKLLGRKNQISEDPYRNYLTNDLGVLKDDEESTWWTTEISGWCGGRSDSAKKVDAIKRLSYEKGFSLDANLLPPERPVTIEDSERANIGYDHQCSLLEINSWEEYYKLRRIPLESPAALLLTFPLTMYYALLKHGAVPITVAKMLRRQLRIHVVGVEKELNFLDLFKELGFLLPSDLNVELVFVVRQDMLPETCNDYLDGGRRGLRVDLTPNLTILVQSGTYNETLDPNFDLGTGPPDILIGLNAGLFAYESWRSVVEYLDRNRGVVGVFTDYNEHSGVNCASLGGSKARESLAMNPFRQPHALPVFSMNLPQFSNGFMYVFNEQELDM